MPLIVSILVGIILFGCDQPTLKRSGMATPPPADVTQAASEGDPAENLAEITAENPAVSSDAKNILLTEPSDIEHTFSEELKQHSALLVNGNLQYQCEGVQDQVQDFSHAKYQEHCLFRVVSIGIPGFLALPVRSLKSGELGSARFSKGSEIIRVTATEKLKKIHLEWSREAFSNFEPGRTPWSLDVVVLGDSGEELSTDSEGFFLIARNSFALSVSMKHPPRGSGHQLYSAYIDSVSDSAIEWLDVKLATNVEAPYRSDLLVGSFFNVGGRYILQSAGGAGLFIIRGKVDPSVKGNFEIKLFKSSLFAQDSPITTIGDDLPLSVTEKIVKFKITD